MKSFVLLIAIVVGVVGLGGKPFHTNRDLTGKNYAMLAICDDLPMKASNVNVTLSLKSDGVESFSVNFRNAKEPIQILEEVSSNITEVVLTAEASSLSYMIQKVTVRIDNFLYKLHINQECDDDEVFATSSESQTFWSRRVDCERKDVYCDDRHDELIGCDNVFVYHLMWRRGATGRHRRLL